MASMRPAAAGAGAPDASAKGAVKASKNSITATRRRLSVCSQNKFIEGIQTLGALAGDENKDDTAGMPESVIKAYAGVSKKGYAPYNPRKRNQDAILMEEHKPTGSVLFGVFDGHGEAGDLVSHYFTERLGSRLFSNPKFTGAAGGAAAGAAAAAGAGAGGGDLGAALAEDVDRLEKSLLADASIDTEFSGSTGVFGVVRGRTLTVANIGDSRVIIGRRDGATGKLKAVEVSKDHKPDREDEMKRIIQRGGRVFAVEYHDGIDGPPRVWLGHMDIPGLAMSRSLGDTGAHTAGVLSEPEMHVVTLQPEDKVLVWASDGLWEFCQNQEVIDMIAGIDDPRKAVDALVAEANARWLKEEEVIDDTTVIVAFLDVAKA